MLNLVAVVALLGAGTFAGANRQASDCPVANVAAVAHTGDPVGKEETHDNVTLYISKPTGGNASHGVLYLTDVFGIQLKENKLLADSFARAGYLTVAPDLFSGSPAPGDINVPGFNTTAFLAKHGPEATDPIIAKAVAYMRDTLGLKRVGATGYCYGGRYSFRTADGKGADVAFAAHPSMLEDGEITGVKGPASVAAAQTDSMMSPERRAQVEALLQKSGHPFSLALYGGTSHGFGVRANVSDPQQKFAKEEAFFQAVRWFDTWL